HSNQLAKIRSTEVSIASTEQKINDLKDVEEKVNEFKAKNAELENRIKVIAELEKMRSGPLLVMDSLSTSIPERAWISEFQTKGQNATIKGIAWNEFTVADFLKGLEASNYFQNVQIKSIEKEEYNNLALRDFEITSNLNFLSKVEEEKTTE
ncbi:MAG: PilN domain-containing protein, partial [Thermodesulfobacteriota bacterium]